MTPALYLILTATPYVVPVDPGILPIIPTRSHHRRPQTTHLTTQGGATNLWQQHQHGWFSQETSNRRHQRCLHMRTIQQVYQVLWSHHMWSTWPYHRSLLQSQNSWSQSQQSSHVWTNQHNTNYWHLLQTNWWLQSVCQRFPSLPSRSYKLPIMRWAPPVITTMMPAKFSVRNLGLPKPGLCWDLVIRGLSHYRTKDVLDDRKMCSSSEFASGNENRQSHLRSKNLHLWPHFFLII